MDKGRGRLAGVILLLVVQAALAAFLGFLAGLHGKEADRYEQYLHPPFTPKPEIVSRFQLETVAKVADVASFTVAGAAIALSLILIWPWALFSSPRAVRTMHRAYGCVCLGMAACLVVVAFFVPRVGSPHNDMLPGLGHFVSAVTIVLLGGAGFGIARLLRPCA